MQVNRPFQVLLVRGETSKRQTMARYQNVSVPSGVTENKENLEAIPKSSAEAWLSMSAIIKLGYAYH